MIRFLKNHNFFHEIIRMQVIGMFILMLFALNAIPASMANPSTRGLFIVAHGTENITFNQERSSPYQVGRTFSVGGMNGTNYIFHGPIRINGNADFHVKASQEGWQGNGTVQAPYIIEGLDITGDVTFGGLVDIRNTNVYFVIRDCIIHDNNADTGFGIILENVSNAVLSHVKVYNTADKGIYLYSFREHPSSNNVIENCEIFNNTGAIHLWNAHDNIIRNCSFHDSRSEDVLVLNENTNNNTIIDNVLYNTPYVGLMIYKSSYNIIRNNTILYAGLEAVNITRTIIEFNTILESGGRGASIWSEKSMILHNNFIKSAGYGLVLHSESKDNYVHGNNFVRNNYVPNLETSVTQAADHGTNNTFDQNYWDDWTYPDVDGDGFVDEPYYLSLEVGSTKKDSHPVMQPFKNPIKLHFLIGPEILYPNGGETLSGNVTIRWKPAFDSHYHALNYTIYYSTNNGDTWHYLVEITNHTSWIWNTMSMPNSDSYKILVIARSSDGDSIDDETNGSFSIFNIENSHVPFTPTTGSTSFLSDNNQTNTTANNSMLTTIVVNTTGMTALTTLLPILIMSTLGYMMSRKRRQKDQR